MRRAAWLSAVLALFFAPAALQAASLPDLPGVDICEPDWTLPSGAVVRVCMPAILPWNGDVVLWAHGYVETTRPVAIPEEQLCIGGSFCVPDLVTALGYAFVTTSYRNNGLVLTGVQDMEDALDYFVKIHGASGRVYMTGASEGGLVTTLAVEEHPRLFDGGVAACGPIGDFLKQVRYYGDFRVLFDYFFPNLLPGSLRSMPPDAIANWNSLWNDTLLPVLFAPENNSKLMQLLRTSQAVYVPNELSTIETTVYDALWYNVFETNDLITKLGGLPYGNMTRIYAGSSNDLALNAKVTRTLADTNAVNTVNALLQTSGGLTTPLVTLHTMLDDQVSYSQETLYTSKVKDKGASAERVNIPVLRYGHCNFKPWEALLSFAIMIARATGAPPANAAAIIPDASDRAAYIGALAQQGYTTPAPSLPPAPGGGTTKPSPAPAPKPILAPTD
jgi:pimeloyl-ACP methyl ester carboxylesterase